MAALDNKTGGNAFSAAYPGVPTARVAALMAATHQSNAVALSDAIFPAIAFHRKRPK